MDSTHILTKSTQPAVLLQKGLIATCNTAFSKFLKTRKSELLGKKLNAFCPRIQMDGTYSSKKLTEILNTNGVYEFQFNIKDKIVPTELHLIHDSATEETLLFVNDIRQYEIIRDELSSFRSLVENNEDTIMRFDRSFRHLYVNKKVEELTGIPVKKFIGKTHEELGFPESLCQLWEKAIRKVFRSGNVNRIEFGLPNGEYIDWYLMPEFDELGKVSRVITTARDITLRKQIENELQLSTRKLQDAMKTAHMATWELDFSNDIFLMDKEFCDYIGLKYPGKNGISGYDYFNKYVYPPDKQKFLELYQEVRHANSKDYNRRFEYRLQINGRVSSISGSVGLIFNEEEGRPIKGYGTVQDITQFKKVENELALYKSELEHLVDERTGQLNKAKEKLSESMSLADLSTYEYDVKTNVLTIQGELQGYFDPKFIKKNGKIKTANFMKLVHPEDSSIPLNAYHAARHAESDSFSNFHEYRLKHVNGEFRDLYVSVKVHFEKGKIIRYYGTIQDITHLRKTLAEKNRLNSIIEATSDIVVIYTPQRKKIIYMNQAALDFYGLKGDKSYMIPLAKIQSRRSKKLMKEEGWPLAEKNGIWTGENRIRRKDGIEIPVSQVVIAHKDSRENTECFSTIIRDLSRQKRTEDELTYKNNELDTFVYRVSHDLRGPIASLMGLYQLVQTDIKDHKALEYFGMFNDQILRLNETILALLDLTRIKELEANNEKLNFEKIVEGAIKSFKQLPNFENINFRKDIKNPKIFINDKSLVTTIVQNLIENSIKYSKAHHTKSYVYISVKPMQRNSIIRIVVSDNGIGIPESIHSKVFNMFYRGNNSAIGSGLGLYIVKNAIEKLRGKISMDSAIDEGTTFTVDIPNT